MLFDQVKAMMKAKHVSHVLRVGDVASSFASHQNGTKGTDTAA